MYPLKLHYARLLELENELKLLLERDLNPDAYKNDLNKVLQQLRKCEDIASEAQKRLLRDFSAF